MSEFNKERGVVGGGCAHVLRLATLRTSHRLMTSKTMLCDQIR